MVGLLMIFAIVRHAHKTRIPQTRRVKHVSARQAARGRVLHVVAANDARVVAGGQLRGGRGRESDRCVQMGVCLCVFCEYQ